MDEADVTLYIKCRDEYSVQAVLEVIENLLNVLKIKYRHFEFSNVLEIKIESSYIFFVRFINQEKFEDKFIEEKYEISDQNILDYLSTNNSKIEDKDFFRYVFGNFIRGEF